MAKVTRAFVQPNPLSWQKGPPPSLGWWIASASRNPRYLRWWDGAVWSFAAERHYTPGQAGDMAENKSLFSEAIEWLPRPDDWPERSRT